MTDLEAKKKLDEAVDYFEQFINVVIPQGLEGIEPMTVMRHYNTLRTELSKLYVDLDV
jgi:predicted fused transcriptional regulator/phosphomethylpyrimidine kinase